MDFRQPVSSLVPGATGRILEVLGRSSADLNASAVARLARVSPSQASRVLPRLVELGVATARHVPPSSLYALNRRHLAAHAIEFLLDSPAKAIDRLRSLASRVSPAPASIAIFGSVARGTATVQSDIDVLVVRPMTVCEDDEDWNSSLALWAERVGSATGNPVRILEVDEDELTERFDADSAIWQDILAEGLTIVGTDLREYVSPT